MRVAFVSIEDAEDVKGWSGIPYFVLQEMRRQGLDIEAISPLRRYFKYCYVPHKLTSKLRGSALQTVRHPLETRDFAAQIERRLRGGDIAAIVAMSSIPISRLRSGIPVLYWTDAVVECLSDYYGGDFAALSQRELRIAHEQEQAALNRASFAIYSSQWAAEKVKALYDTAADRIRVIEFGANLTVDHNETDIAWFVERRLASRCVLLFIGVDWERKGGALAFEAAKLLNERGIETVLKVVGCNAPRAPFVEQLGFVSKHTRTGREKIKDLLTTSTFFILPTRAEAAGIVFCEAAAYGLPSLATRTGGVESYVDNSRTGYCLPLDAQAGAYADLVAMLLSHPTRYRQLSLAAFHRYRSKLNWNAAVTSLRDLIERAVWR